MLEKAEQIGKYRLLGKIGQDRSSVVYNAQDVQLNRPVAIKILHPHLTKGSDFPDIFKQKMMKAMQLQHPNIVPVLDFGQDQGHFFYTMPIMIYGSIGDQIRQYGAIDPVRTKNMLEQIATGLAYAHSQDVFHGNITPNTILIDENCNARIAAFYLADVGSWNLGAESLAGNDKDKLTGTPCYKAPELMSGGAISPASDIYSLGKLAHEMLTGRALIDKDGETQIQEQVINVQPRISDDISFAWESFLERCLAKDPADRYRTINALIEDLRWGLFDTDVEQKSEAVCKESSRPNSNVDKQANAGGQTHEYQTNWQAVKEDHPHVDQWYGLDPYAPTSGQALEMQTMQKVKNPKAFPILLSIVLVLMVMVGVLIWRTSKPRVDLKDPNILTTLKDLVQGSIHEIQLSPDGKTIAVASSNGIYFYDSKTLNEKSHFAEDMDVNSLSWSRDGKLIASGGQDNTVRLWNYKDGTELNQMLGHEGPVNRVTISGDGSKVASASEDSTVRVWDIQTGEELNTLTGHSGSVNAVAFSPNDESLATGSEDGVVRVWNVDTGELIIELDTEQAAIINIEFIDNGTGLECWIENGKVQIWDFEKGELVYEKDIEIDPSELDEPDILDGISDFAPNEGGSIGEGVFDGPIISKDTWFGMGSNTHMRSKNIAKDYAEMAKLGVRFVREDIPWQEIQVSNNSFNLDYRGGILQKALIEAERNGLEVVGILAYKPGDNVSYSNNAEFISLWASYVQKVVDQYGDYIDYWEIGNEVNTWWHKVRPDQTRFEATVYSEMLYEAYTIIKEADPTDTVILSSLVNIDDSSQGLDPFQVLTKIGSAKPGNYCDALALHLYWPGRDPDEAIPTLVNGREANLTMGEYVQLFISESERILDQSKPVWITEVGYDFEQMGPLLNKYGLDIKNTQATMLIKTYVTLLSIPEVQGVFWYTWHNDTTGQRFELLEVGKNAYGTLTTALAGSQPMGKQPVVDVNGNVVESGVDYRFRRSDGKVISYFWATDDSLSDVGAKLIPGDNQTVKMYQPDNLLKDKANYILSPEEFLVHMGPRVMIGAIEPSAKIVVGETTQTVKNDDSHPIVYIKNYNIWAYFPNNGKKEQLTFDGGDNNKGGASYVNIRVSPSGKYLGFEQNNIRYGILEISTRRTEWIPMNTKSDDYVEGLLGWDINDNFYYVLADKGCLPYEEMNPSGLKVWRVNAEKVSSPELIYTFPDGKGHSYSRGLSVSRSGRYITYDSVACSIGGPFEIHVVDTSTGKVFSSSIEYDYRQSGMVNISSTEKMIASLAYYKNKNASYPNKVTIEILNLESTGTIKQIQMPASITRWPWPDKAWSYDDRYFAFTESNNNGDLDQLDVLYKNGIVEIGEDIDEPSIVYLAGDGISESFVSWSPFDYRYLVLKRDLASGWPIMTELWMYDLNSSKTYLIDTGVIGQEIDW